MIVFAETVQDKQVETDGVIGQVRHGKFNLNKFSFFLPLSYMLYDD